jgi:hypothetical protein
MQLGWISVFATAAAIAIAALGPVSGAVSPGELRAAILDIEWRTPTGYERCAAVITARRPHGLEAKTAGHCANVGFSAGRFFDGYTVYGGAIRVVSRSENADAATLFVNVDDARVQRTPIALPARAAPALGTTLTVIGHPVAALRAPNEGRWTVTYARMGETVQNGETGAREYEIYCSRCGPGDSGSGVFDGEGRLVGIVYGITEIDNVANGRLPDGTYANVIPVAQLR